MAESEEELKSLLMKVKEESEKAGLKSNIQKMKIMASGPIPSWQSEAMNWYFWTVVLEKTLESPLDLKKIQLVHPKGNQSWIFIGRTDAEAESPVLWPPDEKNWLIWKDPNAGKDWGQEQKGTTEDEMVGWHHWLNGHEFG